MEIANLPEIRDHSNSNKRKYENRQFGNFHEFEFDDF